MRTQCRSDRPTAPRGKARWTVAVAILAGCGVFSATAQAQEDNSPAINDLKRMVDQQQQQIRQMQQQMAQMQQPGQVQRIDPNGAIPAIPVSASANAGNMAAPVEVKPGTAVPPGQPYTVGSDLSTKPEFKNGLFLWFATPNNDFTMHIGGWAQWDNIWFDQSPALKVAPGTRTLANSPGIGGGVAPGGIGNLQDGDFFRRVRLFFEGTFWEQGEYRIIPAFENDQFQTVGLDEFWFGAKDIPYFGTVRLGHVKDTIGLEGDMTASSRCMTFMERSAYSEAIELNQNFVTGVWIGDNYLDQRVTWSGTVFRSDIGSSTGAYFGDGQGGVQGRLTALPVYGDDGRDLVHVAVSGGFRTNDNPGAFRQYQLRARQTMRDDDPAGGVTAADNNRLIDTGTITATGQSLLGTEFLWIRGPFSVQAEYGWNFIDGATATAIKTLPSAQNYVFDGGYVQLAYTLTGENRAYDRRGGTLAREYFGKSGPYSDLYWIRDDDNNMHCGSGAWEVAARYDYVNLDDGVGASRIVGGRLNGFTLGLNCYANTNFNVMFDWTYDQRDDVPANSASGWVSGLGTEVQFQF